MVMKMSVICRLWVILCVLVWFLSGKSTAEDPIPIYLNISIGNNNTMICLQNMSNLNKYAATLLEGEPLVLRTSETRTNHMNYMSCADNENPEHVFKNSDDYNDRRLELKIDKVTKDMASTWNCTVRGFKTLGNIRVEPSYYSEENRAWYAQNSCYVKVYVIEKESPHKLLVNRVIQETTISTALDQPIIRTAIYNYTEGEEVEILCLHQNDICTDIEFQYDYAAQLDSSLEKALKAKKIGAGLRTTLRFHNSGTSLTCKCAHSKNQKTDIITLTFLMRDISDDDIICKINNLVTRGHTYNKGEGVRNDIINYAILKSTENKVDVVCKIYNKKKAFGSPTMTTDIKPTYNKTWFYMPMSPPKEYTILVNDGTANFQTDNITIKFEALMYLNSTDVAELSMIVSSKPIIDLFILGKSNLMYYEYDEDGDNVTVTCSIQYEPSLLLVMDFNGTMVKETNSKSTYIKLDSSTDQLMFTCKMAKEERIYDCPERDSYYRHSEVIFRQKKRTTTTSTTSTSTTSAPVTYGTNDDVDLPEVSPTESTGDQIIIIGAVICVTGIVLIVVIVVMCKRRRNKPRATGDPNYENLQSQSEASIPAYPPQWSRAQEEVNYQVPVDVRKDDAIYAQPVAEDPYATPIPKSLRPGKLKKQANEPTYAELNLPSSGRIHQPNSERSDYATVGELYSQVLPKAARKNNQNAYDNVFPDSRYVNSGNTEYVEPAYCQPHHLK